MNDQEIVKEFQRNRRETFRIVAILLIAACLCLTSLILFNLDFLMILILILITFLFMASAIIVISTKYRCPICKKIPWTDSFTEQGGVDLNPDVCPNCKAQLK